MTRYLLVGAERKAEIIDTDTEEGRLAEEQVDPMVGEALVDLDELAVELPDLLAPAAIQPLPAAAFAEIAESIELVDALAELHLPTDTYAEGSPEAANRVTPAGFLRSAPGTLLALVETARRVRSAETGTSATPEAGAS